jgi:hypothetical protein
MYENGKQYEGVYGGVAVTFTLQNFNQSVVEKFNEALAREAVKFNENRGGQYSRVSS